MMVGSVFEEEFVGPTLVVQNTTGIPSFEQQPLNTKDEKTTPVHCPSYTDDFVGPSIEVNSNLVPNRPSSSMTFNQAQVACLVDLVEPIENPVLNGARIIERSNESVPNRNSPIVDEGKNVIQDDPELDDLLSSFQRLSETANDNHSKCEKRGKSKPRKKNLVVGGASCPPPLVSHSDDADAGFVGFVDEECAMKIIGEHIGISVNCNGLGAENKRSWIRNLIEKDSPMFLGVQETKIESFDPSFIRSLWPHSDVEFHFSSAIGASGGILTMWSSRVFSADQKVADRNFLCVLGSWVGVSVKVGLINVYAPQASSQKAALWASIESLINSMEAIWVIYGDFNVVRNSDERLGSHFDEGEANAFNDFISRAGLFDLPLGGRRFTRFSKDGNKVSKLDRFMVSQNFFDIWNDAFVIVLCWTLSDHCPIILKVGRPNFGPKPFKVFDKWIGDA
ncbi:RNA-directed DNA polymerase, eukaryota [Tanacetum coccineum]